MISGGSRQVGRASGTTSVVEIAVSMASAPAWSMAPCWRSTTSESNPVCAITSAECDDGMPSQPLFT